MKFFVPILALLLLLQPVALSAQDCQADGNIVIFANYDGGYLTIDVNQDIPNLKVGISTYEPVSVVFTGAFTGNITEVVYAGYQPLTGTGNFHCDNDLAVTTVAAPPNATVTILNYPPVTLISPDVPLFPGSTFLIPAGNNGGIIGCTTCSNDTYQGGVNTAEQIGDFFATYFNGEVLFLKTQYACWCGVQNLDVPATCCTELNPNASVAISTSTGGTTLCDGSSLDLSAGPGYISYAWSTGANTPSISISSPGAYSVTITSTCGPATDDIVITEESAPDLTIDASPDYGCVGGVIQAGVNNPSGTYDFTILNASGAPVPNTGGLATGLPAGSYTVEVSEAGGGCPASATVDVIVSDPFQFGVSAQDADCLTGTGSIFIDFTALLPDTYTYQVLDAGGQVAASGPISGPVNLGSLAPGSYEVSVSADHFPCAAQAGALIQGTALTLASEEVQDVVCGGESTGSIAVEVVGGQAPYTYAWTNAFGAQLGAGTGLENIPAGIYFLEITDSEGCQEAFEWTIEEPAPLVVAIEGPASGLFFGEEVLLNAVVSPPYSGQLSYLWSGSGDLSCLDCAAPVLTANQAETILLVVTTAEGCTASATYTYEVLVIRDRAYYLPTIFSPNADGINDYLRVYPGEGVQEVRVFRVYDRWGGQVYDSGQDPTGKGWDGTLGGEPLPAGVYAVFYEVLYLDGLSLQGTQGVTLVR
jgi:gliding motility-associated-like protein